MSSLCDWSLIVFFYQEVLNSTENKYPYQMAVEELHKLVTMFCPLEKLECLGILLWSVMILLQCSHAFEVNN